MLCATLAALCSQCGGADLDSGENDAHGKEPHAVREPGSNPKQRRLIMEAAKYTIEYTISLGRHTPTHRYDTDSPVPCTEFPVELLEHGFNVTAILREGMPLEPKQADHF